MVAACREKRRDKMKSKKNRQSKIQLNQRETKKFNWSVHVTWQQLCGRHSSTLISCDVEIHIIFISAAMNNKKNCLRHRNTYNYILIELDYIFRPPPPPPLRRRAFFYFCSSESAHNAVIECLISFDIFGWQTKAFKSLMHSTCDMHISSYAGLMKPNKQRSRRIYTEFEFNFNSAFS